MAWPSGRVRGRVVSRSNHLSDRAGDVARVITGNSGFQRPNPEGERAIPKNVGDPPGHIMPVQVPTETLGRKLAIGIRQTP